MFQFWNGSLDTAQRPLCTEPVEFAGRAGAHQTFDQAQAIALAFDDVGDDSEFGLDAVKLKPSGGNCRSDARLHAAQQRLTGARLSLSCLHRSPHAAKEIDFPGGVDSTAVGFNLT